MKWNRILLIVVLLGNMPCGAQLIPFREHNKVGYKNASGLIVVPPKYNAGSRMKEGFAIVMSGNKRGYLNAAGNEVIPCRYDDASLFEQGLACVQINGRYGFINAAAAWAIQPIYDNAFSFTNGLARVCRKNKWGMINPQGTVVIPVMYDRLYDPTDGLIAASEDGMHYGYIDTHGKVILDFSFTSALPFDEQTHRAIATTKNGPYYISKKGRLLEKVKNEEEEEARERGAAKENDRD